MAAARTSRRGFLAAGTAAALTAPAIAIQPPAALQAEAAFVRWITLSHAFNSAPADTRASDGRDPEYDRLVESEAAAQDLPPSIAAAAAVLLIEISYDLVPGMTPNSIGAEQPSDAIRVMARTLAYLRPSLDGTLRRVADDLLGDPGRDVGRSLLVTVRNGRAPLSVLSGGEA